MPNAIISIASKHNTYHKFKCSNTFYSISLLIAMGEDSSLKTVTKGLQISVTENGETSYKNSSYFSSLRPYNWWIQMIIYSLFVLSGQNLGTILGRLYFDNGGDSKWLATLVQSAGFPILFPFMWIQTTKNNPSQTNTKDSPSHPIVLPIIYLGLGILLAADEMLFTIGLQYLPVTTYTLICTSQMGFNAIFSYFLNAQKFTPYIVNSLVLLTISSVLLVFQTDPGDSNKSSKSKYVIGFLSTIAASAGYALMISITQLVFQKIIKKETLRAIVNLNIYQNLVASLIIVIGVFASGDWKKLDGEMRGYKLGKLSYVMVNFWTAVSWQVFGIGSVGLIFKVSSLFSNIISILGLPIGPVLSVIFLNDKFTGLKVVSMVLAIWGFISYMYQHYLDDLEMKKNEQELMKMKVTEADLLVERG